MNNPQQKAPEAIQMPPALANKFRFVKPLYGGPIFDFPQYNLRDVDMSNLAEPMAERLLKKGWAGIARVEAPVSRMPATTPKAEKE